MKRLVHGLFLFFILTIVGCKTEKDDNEILGFYFTEIGSSETKWERSGDTLYVEVPETTNLLLMTPVFTLSDGATISPSSQVPADFTKPVTYIVTSESRLSRTYVVIAHTPLPLELKKISLSDNYVDGEIADDAIRFTVPYGTNLSAIKVSYQLNSTVSVHSSFASGNAIDLSSPYEWTIRKGKDVRKYILSVAVKPQDVAVRAVWLPSSEHTASFMTYANAQSSIALLDELNFNTLYLCAWAGQKTCFDSEVLNAHSTWGAARNGNFFAGYSGGSGDALKDIIQLAHAKNIKVILWFEYGFMADWKAQGTGGVTNTNRVYAKHPEWIGINSNGGHANYNGTDYYFNGYDPEVQEFMIQMMEEALTRYPDLDGIQGDDRMPAAPRNSGYESVTKALYKADKGVEPPADFQNSEWVRWRLDRLNAFGRLMHQRIRAKKANAIVCFSPNKYPWCEQNLMQEWPQWIRDGIVQILSVQCYVLNNYSADVTSSMNTIKGITNTNLLNPGMILKNGNTLLSETQLVQQLKINREKGTNGESQFWFDGLKQDYVKKVFKAFYAGKAQFPSNL